MNNYADTAAGISSAPERAMALTPTYPGETPLGRAFSPVFRFGPIGSRGDTLYYSPKCGGVVSTGCFTGTLTEFEAAVGKHHADNHHGRAYTALIAMLRALPAGYPIIGDDARTLAVDGARIDEIEEAYLERRLTEIRSARFRDDRLTELAAEGRAVAERASQVPRTRG